MKSLLTWIASGEALRTVLNIGGVLLVVVGLSILPIHISFRLILVGAFFLLAWAAYNR